MKAKIADYKARKITCITLAQQRKLLNLFRLIGEQGKIFDETKFRQTADDGKLYDVIHYYIIRVNELPGVCTDATTIEEGLREIRDAIEGAVKLYLKNKEPIPEPIKKEQFKGQIAYRTTSERHYHVAKAAKAMHKSISKTIDDLIDAGLDRLSVLPH